MFRKRMNLAGRGRFLSWGLAAWAAMLAGCGGGSPYKIAPVTAKVTYTDGTPIPASRLVVQFVPQNIPGTDTQSPAPAMGEVTGADGILPGLTTVNHLDGAIVGHHKVVIQALKIESNVEVPTNAVPERYRDVKTTPLEVDVPSGGATNLVLKIEKQ